MRKASNDHNLPVIAAVRDPRTSDCAKVETWQLCTSEKQVLERADEDILWVTDQDTLFDELHHRTGGSDLYTFVKKDTHETSVFVHPTPRWVGPLDIKLFRKFLEKHPNVCLPIDTSRYNENERTIRKFVNKLKKLPLWENYVLNQYDYSYYLEYTPGAGIKRREIQAVNAANTKYYKQERLKAKKANFRYTTSIPTKDLGRLSIVLYRELSQQLPKKVAAAMPNFYRDLHKDRRYAPGAVRISKSKIIKHIILCGGLLRVLNNPHHQRLSPTLRKALEKLTPHIKELKSKVIPFSDLGQYLNEEVVLLAKEGYILET